MQESDETDQHNDAAYAAYAACEVLISTAKAYRAQLDAPFPNIKAFHHMFEVLRATCEDLCTHTNAMLSEPRTEDDDEPPNQFH